MNDKIGSVTVTSQSPPSEFSIFTSGDFIEIHAHGEVTRLPKETTLREFKAAVEATGLATVKLHD